MSDTGHRCEAKSALELDHIQPYARGGHTRASNLRLRCRAHNQLAAEQVYGAAFMCARRNGTRPQSALRAGACGDPVDGCGAGS